MSTGEDDSSENDSKEWCSWDQPKVHTGNETGPQELLSMSRAASALQGMQTPSRCTMPYAWQGRSMRPGLLVITVQ